MKKKENRILAVLTAAAITLESAWCLPKVTIQANEDAEMNWNEQRETALQEDREEFGPYVTATSAIQILHTLEEQGEQTEEPVQYNQDQGNQKEVQTAQTVIVYTSEESQTQELEEQIIEDMSPEDLQNLISLSQTMQDRLVTLVEKEGLEALPIDRLQEQLALLLTTQAVLENEKNALLTEWQEKENAPEVEDENVDDQTIGSTENEQIATEAKSLSDAQDPQNEIDSQEQEETENGETEDLPESDEEGNRLPALEDLIVQDSEENQEPEEDLAEEDPTAEAGDDFIKEEIPQPEAEKTDNFAEQEVRLQELEEQLAQVQAEIEEVRSQIEINEKDFTTALMPGNTPSLHEVKKAMNDLEARIAQLENGSIDSPDEIKSEIAQLNRTLEALQTLLSDMEVINVYRVYNPNSGEHFFTSNKAEYDWLSKIGWMGEGVGWAAPKNETLYPVYRLYNPNEGGHHYTISAGERDILVTLGWRYEGIAFQSDQRWQGEAIWRTYNPNSRSGAHLYTNNLGEASNTIRLGWSDEGVGWYARFIYSIAQEEKNGVTGIVYYDLNDQPVSGEVKITGNWYHFDPNTHFRSTGMTQTAQGWKYYNLQTGARQYGNQFVDFGNNQLYYFDGDGVRKTNTTFRLNNIDFTADASGNIVKTVVNGINYLSQRDGRWAYEYVNYYNFASTGCVPTVLAMIINRYTANVVTPIQLGRLLGAAGLMNTTGYGTSGNGIMYISRWYGLNLKPLSGLEQAAEVLRKGGVIAAAMNPGIFSTPGVTHEILVYGYNNGVVQVLDPYWTEHNGSYNLGTILAQGSTAAEDLQSGGPFFGFLPW